MAGNFQIHGPMRRPSILFINRVYPPLSGATGRCLQDLAIAFAESGWMVTLVVDGPPEVAAATGAAGPHVGLGSSPVHDRLTIVRSGVGQGSGSRFELMRTAARLLRIAAGQPPHDVIVTMTDPPLLAMGAPILRRRHKGALIHWSQDVYPDLFAVAGHGWPAGLERTLRFAMDRALDGHDLVIAIGQCMADHLARGVSGAPIRVVPNWADPAIEPRSPRLPALRERLGLTVDQFVLMHAGNLGLTQPFGALIEAVRRAHAIDPGIHLMLVGTGRRAADIAGIVANEPVGALSLWPPVEGEALSDWLGLADAHVVAMAPTAAGRLVPSKLAGILAAGRPTLFVGPARCDAARLVTEHGVGLVVEPDDPDRIARSIIDLRRNATVRAAMAAAAAASAPAVAMGPLTSRWVDLATQLLVDRRTSDCGNDTGRSGCVALPLSGTRQPWYARWTERP